jgi:hypothetical protein
MRLNDYKIALVNGGYNGIVLSLIINILVVLLRYINFTKDIYYFTGFVFTAITAYLFLRSEKIWSFVISSIFGILLFIVIENILIRTGIINMVLSLASDEASPGEGFAILLMIAFCLMGSFIGVIAAFISTLMKQRECR